MAEFLTVNDKRTHYCTELSAKNVGERVCVMGWAQKQRDLGALIFIDLRDRSGILQLAFDDATDREIFAKAFGVRAEYVLLAKGVVRMRGEGAINKNLPTGEIEIAVDEFKVISAAQTPPFEITENSKVNAELRLRHRYLDLRRPDMQRNIIARSRISKLARDYYAENGFIDIETPNLCKPTPEGARDYLIPSRVHKGKFYALPQSPQLYKQLLMVSGFDRYFQIARCYRDEDARGDRQPEFTQIDMEMSFVSRDDVLSMTEGMMAHVFQTTMGVQLETPFPRIAYDDAMDWYGSDKPELRFDMKMQDAAFMAEIGTFQAFKDALAPNEKGQVAGAVKALVVPGAAADYSRKKIEELEGTAKIYKARGLGWTKVAGSEAEPAFEGGIAKFFEGRAAEICSTLGAKTGDLLLFVADQKKSVACTALGAVRSRLGKDLNLCDPDQFAFAWIVDFPMFEWNEEENKWDTAHHMFTMPQEKYHATLESDPASVKGDLYDLVLNGYELASGSIRIHDPQLQKRIFQIVGFDEAEGQKKFGFLTEAFKYGAPPHGGIAPGLDRLVMLMCKETSIKEVIAFPKNTFAQSPMDDCPSEVDQQQLDDLHLIIRKD